MNVRRRQDYDESDVHVRSGRGSRPRTKTRPEHADAEQAMVVTVDRGRWGCVLAGDPTALLRDAIDGGLVEVRDESGVPEVQLTEDDDEPF